MSLNYKQIFNSWSKLLNESIEAVVYHGSGEDIQQFDFSRATEFGIHFGSLESAQHRGQHKGQNFHVKKYMITIRRPLELDDVMRWNAENILNNMASKGYIKRVEASQYLRNINKKSILKAKENQTSLRLEKNLMVRSILEGMGYDGIVYDNKGESGGKAFIVLRPKQIKEIK